MNQRENMEIDTALSTSGRRKWMKNAAVMIGSAAVPDLLRAQSKSGQAEGAAATAKDKSAAATRIVVASTFKAIVETSAGKVRGFTRNGIYAFKGMPYAATTEGKNRFMPPVKVEPWTGVRSSLALGPVCPQAYTSTFEGRRTGWSHDEEAFMFEWDDGIPSEDCLRINVWTPSINDNRKRPVMVWIHGGGFQSGSSNELRMYDGESLSRRGDVVVVSLNHRLGALGYLNLAEYGDKWIASANVGMLDLVAGLEWVRDNIGNFGGDPSKTMIFGQSGGGSKVGTLMAMPSAKGLFQRAAIQSGSGLRQATPEQSAQVAAAVIAELGLSRATIDRIQEFPNERIVQAGVLASQKLPATLGTSPIRGMGGLRWSPTVDGKILPRQPWDPDAPPYSTDVPFIVGTVLNEFANSVQAGDPSLDEMPMQEARKLVAAQYGDKADAILQVFAKAHPKATSYELYSRISGASSRQNAITQVERKAAQNAAPAYLYWFTWQTPILDGRPRAFHCAELPFCFYNTDRCAAMTGGGADAQALAAKISDAWIHFAREGDPNHSDIPRWPKFSASDCPTMIFDNVCEVRDNPDKAEREILKS
jgi:para-nitrobenzyl esterase